MHSRVVKVAQANANEAEPLLRAHADTLSEGEGDITVSPGDTLCIRDEDKNLIERYVATQYAPIEWDHKAEEVRNRGTGELRIQFHWRGALTV